MNIKDNSLFINYLKILQKQRGYKLAAISKSSGIDYERLRRLNYKRGIANHDELMALLKAYPDLEKQNQKAQKPVIDNQKTQELEDRITQLERQVIKILNQLDTLKA